MKIIELKNKKNLIIFPIPPYNFDKTVYDPSHFPTPIEVWGPGKF